MPTRRLQRRREPDSLTRSMRIGWHLHGPLPAAGDMLKPVDPAALAHLEPAGLERVPGVPARRFAGNSPGTSPGPEEVPSARRGAEGVPADFPGRPTSRDDACSPHDQRGVARSPHPLESCDTGALERTTGRVRTPIFADGYEQGDEEAWSSAVLRKRRSLMQRRLLHRVAGLLPGRAGRLPPTC